MSNFAWWPTLRLALWSHRAQALEHGRRVELVGRAGIAVRERDVGGLAGCPSDRDADKLGAHVAWARGRGVERDELRGVDARDERIERIERRDRLVAKRGRRGWMRFRGVAARRGRAGSRRCRHAGDARGTDSNGRTRRRSGRV
jgi:hypothetical protein